MANTDEQVWSLGGTLLENQSLSSFFDVTGSTVVTEPGLLYDNLSGEWFATAVDSSNNTLLFATSLTSDPLGPWMQYFVPAYPNERPNQPSLGASEWMVGIAANDVNETTQNLDGTGYILLNRTDLKTGELAYYEVNPEYWDPNGRAENALTPSAVQWFGGMENPPRSAFWIGWADAPPALPSEENGYAAVSGFSPSPAASQPGTLDLLNTSDGGDARVTSAFWQNDLETLTFSTGTGCPTGESCLGLVQLWTNNSTLRQDLLVTSASDDLFYPAASADAEGDLTVVAGFSSTVTYPSAYIFGQAANEPGSLAAGSFVAVNGTASVTTDCNSAAVCDYGFSFGAASEPNSSTVWTASEYPTSGSSWSTWIHAAETRGVSISGVADPSRTDVGQLSNLTATASGGTSPLGDYVWTGLPPGCSSLDSPTLECAPTAPGNYSVTVAANDTYPRYTSATISLLVSQLPAVSTPRANLAGADVGQLRTFSTTASLGTLPYDYDWEGLPTTECANPTSAALSCELPSAGNLSVSVTVTDGAGVSATSAALSYLVSPALRFDGIGAYDFEPQRPGSTVTFVVDVSGGSGGENFTWHGLPGPCTNATGDPVICTPSAQGTFDVTARVTDSNGGSVSSLPFSYAVVWPAASTGPPWYAGPDGWALEIVAGAVGVAAVALLYVRRNRARGNDPSDRSGDDEDAPPPAE
ncbi:MAG: hypothetical protein WB947_07345 [Thermoplasmata archaeon]